VGFKLINSNILSTQRYMRWER